MKREKREREPECDDYATYPSTVDSLGVSELLQKKRSIKVLYVVQEMHVGKQVWLFFGYT